MVLVFGCLALPNIGIRRDSTRLWGRSCIGGRMGDKGQMTWWKSVKGQATMVERLVNNETHPFSGMVRAIGESKGMEVPFSPKNET